MFKDIMHPNVWYSDKTSLYFEYSLQHFFCLKILNYFLKCFQRYFLIAFLKFLSFIIWDWQDAFFDFSFIQLREISFKIFKSLPLENPLSNIDI